MAWVRIHDGAMTHPKLVGLSDKAFRLWVWGLAYSQQHLTDGLITAAAVPARLKRASDDLIASRLWDTHGLGFKVHDYLDWNDSRETVISKREGAKNRLQRWTDKRVSERVANATSETPLARSGVGSSGAFPGKGSGEKPDDLTERAARLRQESYPAWFHQHRGGYLPLTPSPKEMAAAIELCKGFSDQRLADIAAVILTTDDAWISQTDRGFWVFVKKASWADDRLRQVERSA